MSKKSLNMQFKKEKKKKTTKITVTELTKSYIYVCACVRAWNSDVFDHISRNQQLDFVLFPGISRMQKSNHLGDV